MTYKLNCTDSSNLEKIEYDDVEKLLRVTFKGGEVYEYLKIEKDIYDNISRKSMTDRNGKPSFGATFIKLVRSNPNIPYRRLK